MSKSFFKTMFGDMEPRSISSQYRTMRHVNASEDKIIFRIAPAQVFETQYGYGLILNRTHVQWLRKWQVSENWYGTYVFMTKSFFSPKEWGDFENYLDEAEPLTFDYWLNAAKAQEAIVPSDPAAFRVYWK